MLEVKPLFQGAVLKQGDKTPLTYELLAKNGQTLNISGETAEVVFLTRDYKKKASVYTATVSPNNTVTFNIDGNLPNGKYYIEFVVGTGNNQQIFPSVNRSYFEVTPSSLEDDVNVIKMVGFEELSETIIERVKVDIDELLNQVEQSELDRQAQEEARVGAESTRETNEQTRLNKDLLRDDKIAQMEADKDAVIANATVDSEVILARGGKATLGQRLDETTAQLAQTDDQINQTADGLLLEANGIHKISFENYVGNDQNMHPKVLYFENGWNGYKFWMGYTPYPFGRTQDENPSIAVSDDGYFWGTPEGLTNPLDDYPGGGSEGGTNSDTHLVYREDINTLELWWRTYNNPEHGVILYRRTTTDGINWTEKEIMTTGRDYISPSIIFEDGKYKMWSAYGGVNFYLQYIESTDSSGKNWTETIDLDIDYGDLNPWHLDVIPTEKGYEMVVSERGHGGGASGLSRDFFYILQRYDGTFTKPRRIMASNPDPDAFDHGFLYRPSIVKVEGIYRLYSSFVGPGGVWGMSVSEGRNLHILKGVDFKGEKEIVELSPGQVLEDYDVSNVEAFILPNNSNEVVFKSLVNGEYGQSIQVLSGGSSSKATFEFSTNLWTPNNVDLTFDNSQRMVTLFGTRVPGKHYARFNVAVYGERKQQKEKKPVILAGNEVLTDYDVSEVSAFIIPHAVGGEGVTFNSFTNAEIGQTIQIVLRNSSSKATFKYSLDRLWAPDGVDYELTRFGKNGATMVCTNIGTGAVRFNVF